MKTNELRQLTERFLAGETSIEEERRLYELLDGNDLTAGQQAIRSILAPHTGTFDTDAWLAEDETAAYDGVMRSRRRRALYVRRTAAAVFAGAVFMAGMVAGVHYESTRNATEAQKSIAQNTDTDGQHGTSSDGQASYGNAGGTSGDGITAYGDATSIRRSTARDRKGNTKTSTYTKTETGICPDENGAAGSNTAEATQPAPTLASMTPYDSLHHLIGNIERELQQVSDSVYIAHVEQLIVTDTRLQQLVNGAMIKDMKKNNRELEATNRIYW